MRTRSRPAGPAIGAVDDLADRRRAARHHGLEQVELGARLREAQAMQRLLAAARQQLQEPLGAGVERAAVDRDRRAGQEIDPGDRHAQRRVGRLALQFARDLLQLHRRFPSMSSTCGHPLASLPAMADSSSDFAQALRGEILRSEQQRMKAVAAVLLFILCFTSIGLQVLPELRAAPVSQRHRMVDAGGRDRPVRAVRNRPPSPSSAGGSRTARISRSRRASPTP